MNKAQWSPKLSLMLIKPLIAMCLNWDDSNILYIDTLPMRDVGGNFDIPL